MNGKRWLVALAGVITLQAQAWTKDYQTHYVLGDSDSRLSAKQNALSQLQLQAIKEAGTYIQGTTNLVNDQLQEQIQQVSAAIVSLNVLSEHFGFNANGQQELVLQARATVDESILQKRVQALYVPTTVEQKLSQQLRDEMASLEAQRQQLVQEQQQQLAAENQRLKQQLQQQAQTTETLQKTLSQQVKQELQRLQIQQQAVVVEKQRVNQQVNQQDNASKSTITPKSVPALAVGTSTQEPEVLTWLSHFYQVWQQTPVSAKIIAHKSDETGEGENVLFDVNWQLSLAPLSPLAELCQRWTCYLGYAYKQRFDDALMTPLHQLLFRPVSRMAHIDDKYLNQWQLLNIQVSLPNNLSPEEQQALSGFLTHHHLAVTVNWAGQQQSWPLVQYMPTDNTLWIRLQGTLDTVNTQRYDSVSREGYVLCALEWRQKHCVADDINQYLWHKWHVPVSALTQPMMATVNAM